MNMVSHSYPRRKRRRDNARDRAKTQLQLNCERAIEAPGGISKVLHLIENASEAEISALNEDQYTPLVGCIFRLGKNTTRKGNSLQSQQQLDELILSLHRRKLSVNSGAQFGARFHRPLIVAAYYGYYSAVRLLLQQGGLPDLRDGEDRNVLHAAFHNPAGSSSVLRECDRKVAEILWDMNAITSDLKKWRIVKNNEGPGRLCYIGSSRHHASVIYSSIGDKCLSTMKFIVEKGGVITDKDFLMISKYKKLKRFLSMVACLESNTSLNTPSHAKALQRIKSWNKSIDWSFPPTWKVSVTLCQNCGLPPDIFRENVVPFLSRAWFFTQEQKRSHWLAS